MCMKLILILILLAGCVNPTNTQHKDHHVIEKEWNDLDRDMATQKSTQKGLEREGVPNFQSIADALGCVFAPQTCSTK